MIIKILLLGHDQLLEALSSTEAQVYAVELQLLKMTCAIDDSVDLEMGLFIIT